MEKEKMICEIVAALERLYWEDLEFIHKFVTGYAKRKHK